MDSPFSRPHSIYGSTGTFGNAQSSTSTSQINSPPVGQKSTVADSGNLQNTWTASRSSSTSNISGSLMGSMKREKQGFQSGNEADLQLGNGNQNGNDPLSGFNAFSADPSTYQKYPAYSVQGSNQYPLAYGNNQQYGQYSQYGQYGSQYYGNSYMPYVQYGQQQFDGGSQQHGNFGYAYDNQAQAQAQAQAQVQAQNSGTPLQSSSALGTSAAPASAPEPPVARESTAASTQGSDIVPPSSIYWCYIDLQGQEQGPFSAIQMNEWLVYLMDTTLMRRSTDSLQVTFQALKQATGSQEPFVVMLSLQQWDAILSHAAELTKNSQQSGLTGSGTSQSDEVPEQSVTQSLADMKLQDTLKEASIEVVPPTSGPNSPIASTVVQNSRGAPKQPESAHEDANSYQAAQHAAQLAAQKAQRNKEADQLAQKKARDAHQAAAQLAAQQTAQLRAIQQQQSQEIQESENHKPIIEPLPQPQQPQQPRILRAEPARAPETDPWKKPVITSPQVSIAELKQQELEKQQQKKKASVSATASRRSSTQRSWIPLDEVQGTGLTSSGSNPQSPTTSSAATWGKKPAPPARSLAEIQKEQASKSSKPVAASPTLAAASSPVKSGRFSVFESNGDSTAAAVGSRVPVASNARAAAVSASAAAPGPHGTPHKRAPKQYASVTQAANSAKPTDELIHWARVAFKELSKSIDQMELLEVFLSLPSNNNAKEFIAESIFDISSVIDGRRFASEFITRKKSAEQTMPAGETWKDVLNRFNPNAQEQDPSFKVVTKKRGPKIARPQ